MKKSLLIIALFVLQTLALRSQTNFQKIFWLGANTFSTANSIQQTADGGFIIAGTDSSNAAQDRDVCLVKTDANGDTLWSRIYGTAGFEYGQYVIQSNDGGYFVVGTSLSADWNVYLIRTDVNGDTLWTSVIGGTGDDEANSVQQTRDGGFIICGYTNSFGAGNYDYFLVKTNAGGAIQWSKAYGTLADELGYSVQETKDKGFIMAGAAFASNSTIDAYAVKTDSLGVVQWSNYYGTFLTDWGYMMRETSDGGYALTGYLEAGATTDIFLIKTNGVGDTLWTRTYGGSDYEQGICVVQTNDSGYAISGSVYSGGLGGSDALLLKTDKLGALTFDHGFGGPFDDLSSSLVQTPDSGFAMAAYSNSLSGGPYNCYVIKTDLAGNVSGGCNEVSPVLNTIQRPMAATAVVTTVTNFTFAPVLSITNIDSGMKEYSPCSSLGAAQIAKANSSLQLYPNPNAGIFNVVAENVSSVQVHIHITNVYGETVYSKKVNNNSGIINEKLDIGSLPGGTYFVSMQAADKTEISRVLIIK